MSKILIVDDERDILEILEVYLREGGYEVLKAENGREALDILEKEEIQLVLTDIMMSDMDGITLCMKIRESKNLPIIMLSAKSQDMDKVMGLSVGADDYVTKPFNPVELLARARAQIRRYTRLNPGQSESKVLCYKELSLDLEKHTVAKNGEIIRLTPTEFKILELLWRNKGVVFSTDRLYNRIWEEEDFEVDNTVMVHIRNLRKKLETDKNNPEYIVTVWGTGYKFGE